MAVTKMKRKVCARRGCPKWFWSLGKHHIYCTRECRVIVYRTTLARSRGGSTRTAAAS
jgi:hypothetical protein